MHSVYPRNVGIALYHFRSVLCNELVSNSRDGDRLRVLSHLLLFHVAHRIVIVDHSDIASAATS